MGRIEADDIRVRTLGKAATLVPSAWAPPATADSNKRRPVE